MKRRKLFLVGVLAAFFTASIFITACNGPNDPKNSLPEALQQLKPESFAKTPDGQLYDQYKVEWTDAAGKPQTKVITAEDVKSGLILPGGIKAGTTARITPQVKNSKGVYEDKTDAAKEETPSTSADWKLSIKAGIDELSEDKLNNKKPDYDKALEHFKNAYDAEKNNTTKAYYAAVQLASISIKPKTVNFMQDKMGFATYPEKLNALANLEWFKTYTETYPSTHGGEPLELSYRFPEMKQIADWYKDFPPYLQIPAYIIEHSGSANVDQLIDELYGILFGAEFTNAESLLNSLDATKTVTMDKKLIKLLNMSGEDRIFPEDTDVELQKDQLLGIIGGLTVAKGAFELAQSYSFNTDLNILKWNWTKEDGILKNLGSYNQEQDPFNNGFLKGRSLQKIIDAKADVVKGADLLLTAYKSLTDSATLPAEAKDELKKETEFIQVIVKEIRDAVAGGREANILIGEDNPLAKNPAYYRNQPGQTEQTAVYRTKFDIDMGKVFKYEYFKLSKLFEMNGNKPKIYPADAEHRYLYMKANLQSFMDDFVTITFNNGDTVFENEEIPLGGSAGQKIIDFYK